MAKVKEEQKQTYHYRSGQQSSREIHVLKLSNLRSIRKECGCFLGETSHILTLHCAERIEECRSDASGMSYGIGHIHHAGRGVTRKG